MTISLPVLFGALTFLSLVITISLGIIKKKVFKYHKIFAFITIILAAIHVIILIFFD